MTSQPAPRIILFGGPNGSGESTVAPRVLADVFHVTKFVYADDIARDALLMYKRAGLPVVGWHNGRVEQVSAEQIPVEDPSANLPR